MTMTEFEKFSRNLFEHHYIVNYEFSLDELTGTVPYYNAMLTLSDSRSVYGDLLKVKLIRISDVKMDSPNIGMCADFALTDVKARQMEHINYLFDDFETGSFRCYCEKVECGSYVFT